MPDLLALRRKIGVLFQDGALFGSMSVFDNVAFPLRQHTDLSEAEIAERVTQRLADVGLAAAMDDSPSQLSGGMRKRAGFARALVMEPDIVIFDEPDSGLDPVRTALLCELIQEMHAIYRGTYIVVTHNIASARQIGEYIALLWRGRIVEAGDAAADVLLGQRIRAPVPERLGRGPADDGLTSRATVCEHTFVWSSCVHLPRFELLVAAGEGSAGRPARRCRGRALAVAPLVRASARRAGRRRGGGLRGGRGQRRERAGWRSARRSRAAPSSCCSRPTRCGWPSAWEAHAARAGGDRRGRRAGAAGARLLRGRRAAGRSTARRRRRSRRRRRALDRPARIGAAPTRFCALAAALAARSRRPLVLEGEHAAALAGRAGRSSCSATGSRPRRCSSRSARLGVRTLGELARLGRAALRRPLRRGRASLAHRLACGEDSPLRPRRARGAPGGVAGGRRASCGAALERVLGVLVDRLLARPERRGRTLRAVALSARLLAGGGWRERVVFRQALADPERIRLALSLRLLALPAPAAALGLAVERFGPPAGEQGALLRRRPAPSRAARAAAARGGRAGARAGRGRRGAAGRLRGSRLARPRAAGRARPRSRSDAPRALNRPRPARVRCGGRGSRWRSTAKRSSAARVLAGRGPLVDAEPLRRRYWELVGERGRNLVVFHDLCSGGWFRQSA